MPPTRPRNRNAFPGVVHNLFTKRLRESSLPRPVVCIASLGLLSACATTSPNALPKYQPPPAGAPAAVMEVGRHGAAWSVDGAETPALAKTLRLAPGEHRVGINCLSFDVVSIVILPVAPVVNTQSALQFVLVTGNFEQGKTYYTRCVGVNGRPRAWLADAPDGSGLPQGFTLDLHA
jgi:hypothetical protein